LPRRVPQNLLSLSETQDQELAAILNLFSVVTEISVSTIIEELGLPRATATRKLSSLVKKGHIKKIGLGRGVRYVKNS
jgi:DNA-binding MarR family transcriptional regulator